MRTKFYLFTTFFIFCFALKSFGQCKEIVGYYPNWQWYDRAQLVNPATIDYSRYTIINYAFFSPQPDGSINSTDAWADENLLLGQPDWQNGGYLPNTSIIDLAHNNGVEVLPSIGGWTLSDNFPAIAANPTTRTAFANACVNLITTYDFDGIDLDWEYPGYGPHNGTPADKQNFTLLLQDLRSALDNLTATTGKTYKITAAVGANPSHMNNVEWAAVSNLLDIINLMSYDFFGVWDGVNNHNSPLYAPAQGDPQFNLNAAFTNLTTTYGVPASKITLGVAFYGRSATGGTTLHGPNSGSANTTLFADDEGTPLYYNILPVLSQFNENWDSQAEVPYLSGISNNTFVSYDNVQSIGLKAQYIVDNGAAGAIIWEITGDYLETSPGSGVIASTPLADELNNVFCGGGGSTNIYPTVNITNPTNNSTLTVGTAVTLTAVANDVDGTITSVIFNVDGQNLTGVLNNGNYEATWTPQNTGSFTISATATDNENATATNTISVTVDNPNQPQPPTIAFTNPTNGAVLTEGNITLQATATDTDGTVTTVVFNVDNQNISATANGNSWSANWTATAGNYTITATATDNDGLTTSTNINVIIQNNGGGGGGTGEIIGTFTLVSDWGTGYCADVTLTNNGTTTINGWTLTFDLPSEITSLWNTGSWSGSAATGYTTDDAGWNGTIAPGETVDFGFCAEGEVQTITNAFLNGIPVDFGGNPPVLDPPTVTIVSPNDGATLAQGNIILSANADDADGNIASVIFEIDGQNFPAVFNNGNWTANWNANAAGTFLINVTATDDDGLTATDNISVTISANPIPPTVTIVSPNDGATLAQGNIILSANADDADGNIASVIFEIDGQNFPAVFNNGNWTANWNADAAGTFLINVTATDDDGLMATDNISVTISANPIPPTVTIVSPNDGATLAQGNIILSANADDADGNITSVIFEIDGQNFPAVFNNGNWTANWNADAAGTFSINVTATDDDGLTATDNISVTISANPIPPTVTIVSPNDGATLAQGNIILSANANDADGNITSVIFEIDGQNFPAVLNNGNWTASWNANTAGIFSINVTATDDDGLMATDNISVTIENNTPGGDISGEFVINSDWGGGYCAEITLTNNGTAAINGWTFYFEIDGDITSLWNGTYTGNQADGYTVENLGWNATIEAGGSVTFGYCADYNGSFHPPNNATLNGIPVIFGTAPPAPNNPPTVSITSPTNNASFEIGTPINLNALATDADGTVTSVIFEIDGQLITGNNSGDNWSATWTPNAIGSYPILATATDDDGDISTASISINIQNTPPPNNPPTVNITSPANNETFEIGMPINLNALATDADGTVVSVIFEINGQLITGNNSGDNWSATWTPNAIGSYSILATATDDDGDISTASIVVIIENPASNNLPPTVNITSPSNGANLLLGAGITLIATASDADGTVADVVFNINGQTLNTTGTGANYQAVWNPPGVGTYSIFATATDDAGATSTTSILVTVFDNSGNNNLTLDNLPLQINFNENETVTYTFDQPITEVLTRNLNVIDISVNGNQVTLTGIHSGRTGLRIKAGGNDYFMGCRVNHADGSIPGMPDYLSVGSVSEDIAGDLAFWEGVETGQMNKSMDIRYIYINGGPINGWQSWGPNRPESFATESLRYGLIPYFVYYNIPDGGESYATDLAHVNDVDYMNAYFADLNLFLDKVQSVLQGEFYGIILEPDFLGYMQQNADPNDPELITTCVSATTIAAGAGNIRTLVERINSTINARRSQGHFFTYGWQLNLWSYPIEGAPHGVIRITDELGYEAGRAEIQNAAEQTALYAIQSGCLSSQADFISIDKYGLDAMATAGGSADPYDATWFFNSDHWNNYLYYASTLYNTTSLPVILWQLPVGHINNSQYESAYTGAQYPPLPNTNTKWEDSSTSFFLGDDFQAYDALRLDYFSENMYGDPNLKVVGDLVTYANHMEAVKDAGIISVLFGAGVGASTDGIGDAPTDDYFWIQKVQDYYINGPVPLDLTMFQNCTNGCPPNVGFSTPQDGDEMVLTTLSPIDISVLGWDQDGHLSNLIVQVDGQTIVLDTAGFFHDATWMPSDFGTFMMTVTATDNDQMTATETITFTITEFDPALCGIELWEASTTYSTPHTQVTWNGAIYENQWWTQGDEPGTGGQWDVWNYVGPCVLPDDSPVISVTNTLPSEELEKVKLTVFPNPTSGATRLKFILPTAGLTQISIFNEMGQVVATPVDEMLDSGVFEVNIKESEWSEGVYFVQLVTEEVRVMQRVVVMK